MLYGLQASKDVMPSCIGRGQEEGIFRAVAAEDAKRVGRDTLVVVDPTEIRKLYALRMPYLARVRDRSKGEQGNGYWGGAAVAGSRLRWRASATQFGRLRG